MKTHAFWCAVAMITNLGTGSAFAEPPKVVTWNINGGEQDKDILADNALSMMQDVGDFDILILQEVISSEQGERPVYPTLNVSCSL